LHREAGISSTTVLAFNNFINRDADSNATLTGTARHEDDDMRALALREVLSAHLEPIFTRIVVEENRIKTHGLVTSTMRQEGARHSIFNSTPLAVCGDGGGGRAASRPCEGSQPSVPGAGLLAGRAVKGVS
jgi:hypothetical protein